MQRTTVTTLIVSNVALIIAYLSIHVWSSADTVNAIWNFIYPLDREFIGFTLASYFAIVLLLITPFFQGKRRFYFSLVGLLLLWVNALSFYPHYFTGQRDQLFNSQYLFVAFTVLVVLLHVKRIYRN